MSDFADVDSSDSIYRLLVQHGLSTFGEEDAQSGDIQARPKEPAPGCRRAIAFATAPPARSHLQHVHVCIYPSCIVASATFHAS